MRGEKVKETKGRQSVYLMVLQLIKSKEEKHR